MKLSVTNRKVAGESYLRSCNGQVLCLRNAFSKLAFTSVEVGRQISNTEMCIKVSIDQLHVCVDD